MSLQAHFLSFPQAEALRQEFGTPLYVYSEALLKQKALEVLAVPAPFGLTVRYAMKACPTRGVLKVLTGQGVEIDASSGYEAERAMLAGIPGEKIMLTAQELPKNLEDLVRRGVFYNACSLHQLETYGRLFPGTEVGVRINPGVGSGANAKVNVGGDKAGFGIWHERIPEVKALLARYELRVRTVHTHIGSGTDPQQWQEVAELSASFLDEFPSASKLNLGGGFKVARYPGEKFADFSEIGARLAEILKVYEARTGRKIHLELEPGTFLVANAGALLCSVQDVTKTNSVSFLKVDTGMTEIIRPAMYGSQHVLTVLNEALETEEYGVVGHCCESADLLTVNPETPDELLTRVLSKASIGDLLVVDGAGAYCSGMSTKNYNSFPEATEVLVAVDGSAQLIRKKQTLDQIVENEL